MILMTKLDVQKRLDELPKGRLWWMKVLSMYSLLCFSLFGGAMAVFVYREFHSYFLSAIVVAILYLAWWLHHWIDMQGLKAAAVNLTGIENILKDIDKEKQTPTY
jgi:hypothetical protein